MNITRNSEFPRYTAMIEYNCRGGQGPGMYFYVNNVALYPCWPYLDGRINLIRAL